MSNSAKRKGDDAERKAVAFLVELAPDLVVPRPRRKLGAGRQDDVGDLDVFPDAVVQVKFWPSDVNGSVRSAAVGAAEQAVNARLPFHTGLTALPRVRNGSVRWVACTTVWPLCRPADDELAVFATVPKALAHVRREDIGVPRRRRIAAIHYARDPEILVAPAEAWVCAYRAARDAVGRARLVDAA